MHETLSTLILVLLTLAALAASVTAALRLSDGGAGAARARTVQGLVWCCTLGAGLLFLDRAFFIHRGWVALQAHVDGLLLIAALFGVAVLFLQRDSRLPHAPVFAMPVMTLLLAWAICASQWTLYVFDIGSIWKTLHLVAVYLGTLFFLVAAITGGMYLYTRRRLRHKADPTAGPPLASLEKTERLIIRASAVGFALLTLGVVMGLIVTGAEAGPSEPAWWTSSKVVLSVVAWALFAIVANVRHAAAFRGKRAAWMSIAGLGVILAIFGVSTLLPEHRGSAIEPGHEFPGAAQEPARVGVLPPTDSAHATDAASLLPSQGAAAQQEAH